MSQFLDGIGKRLSDAGQGVAKHTKNFTEVTRLNGAIAEQERQAAALLRELGQACYDRHQNDPDYEYAAQIEGIRAAYAQIAQYQAQIRQIKGIRICPECGGRGGTGFRLLRRLRRQDGAACRRKRTGMSQVRQPGRWGQPVLRHLWDTAGVMPPDR